MKLLTATLLAASAACSMGASAQGEFDGASAFGYVETQVSFGPRVPNTEGHRRAGDWILEHLRGRADSVEVQAFTHVTSAGDTLQLRNLIARFRPEVPDRILYLAHWDTRPRADQSANMGQRQLPILGANDGASGVAVLLGVADVLARRPPAVGVDLVFVDGEDYGDWAARDDVLLGSRHYAASLDPSARPLFAVVWDMVGDRDLEIFQERHSAVRAPEVVERVWSRAGELGYGRFFRPSVLHSMVDDHIPLLDVGVRAIDVIDFDYGPNNAYWHTTDDTLDKVSAESLKIVGDVAVALLR
ncbi:MAG: M28 family peptidase [Gemmatimonadales bacterium]|nr:M28 family peptidase [Gemmatimonadales bacterium]NIN11439.1 M28 family peptidase [Gemmatimonadales bacterium]NIN50048.1 M28 family peptidase [Gemmatimonadales bacterium]NIP07512.1 M28 family peptidase [Gemmatimonadales bacterium]NIR03154.1 M28 family peptidase [Gemmatimonadales bacterium]